MTLPLGVVLAGGTGRRIGGDKALVELDGRPLLHYPLAALREVVGEVVVVCKEHTALPDLAGMAAVWCDPEERHHPLIGVRSALRAVAEAGRPVLVCAVDLPLVTPEVLRELLGAGPEEAPAAVARAAGYLQPLLARYSPAALGVLDAMAPDEAATRVVERMSPVMVETDGEVLLNVNAPEDVLRASAALAERERVRRNA